MSDIIHDFGVNKVERLKRSRWNFPMSNITNFRQGALIPFGWTPVIPSETISCNVSSLIRLALTLAKPVMGDMYFTYGAYFVPYRILFKDYEEMFGAGKPTEWSNPVEYVLPSIPFMTSGSKNLAGSAAGYDAVVGARGSVNSSGQIVSIPGNLANYLGLPETYDSSYGTNYDSIDMAPFAAYERIWSDFWRDENYQNEDPDLEKVKALAPGSTGVRTNLRFHLHYANRFHDYFTSLLPAPQKGPAVSAFSNLITLPELYTVGTSTNPIVLGDWSKSPINANLATSGGGKVGFNTSSTPTVNTQVGSTNLGVNIGVDELRQCFALQRARERNARCGSRFVEAMLGTFEAHLPNSVAQKAEFLGGNTISLNKTSVPSTYDTPGKLGAFSATGGNQSVFVKTFNEPGILMFVGTVRIKHHYTQGISPFFQKFRRYQAYDPAFAHISEQPVARKQYIALSDDSPDGVLGFNEPFVEYRKPIDLITGNLRHKSGQTDINAWTFQEDLTPDASISPEIYYPEDRNEIATCCVDYNNTLPDWVFIGHFKISLTRTGPMPVYSIPGFIDHLIA